MSGYPSIGIKKKTGDEVFCSDSSSGGISLLDFWKWSASDLITNSSRGALAEYIVASALGVADGVRVNWDAFDLKTKSGLSVEVKSAAYLQTWYQKELSKIIFGIRPTHSWEPETNILSEEKKRQADVYVFCLLDHKDQATLNPMNLDQWLFCVVSTKFLNSEYPTQKSISLSALKKHGFKALQYGELAKAVESEES